jgi:type IV secretion system protein VirB8
MFRVKSKGDLHAQNPVQALDWLYDMYQSRTVWMNRALIGMLVLAALLALSLIALVILTPLKEKVPYVYTVDKATGEITKLGALEPTKLTENWAMSRYFLMHYVINRESYDNDNLTYPYQMAYAMTSPALRNAYLSAMDSGNPNSPSQQYGARQFVTVHVIAISKLSEDTASVRFQKILHDRTAGTTQTAEREAIVKWQYQANVEEQKLRDRNPLGFYITYYQSSPVSLETPTPHLTPSL